jgi:hypothetical protein
MAKKVVNNSEVKVSVDLDQFDGELEFECTGKSRHLKAGLKVNLRFDLAKLFKRLGYIK